VGSPLIQLVQQTTAELGLPVPSQVVRAPDNTGRQLGALANRIGRMLLRMHDWTFLTREWHISIPTPVQTTANTVAASPILTLTDTTVIPLLKPGRMVVTGNGIMTAVRLIAVDSVAGTATLDEPVNATQTAAAVIFRTDFIPNPPDYERMINRTQWDRTMRWELRGPMSPQSDQWVRSGIVATGPRRQYRQIDAGMRIWPSPAAADAGSQLITEYISLWWAMSAGGIGQPTFLADQDTCWFEDDVVTAGLKWLFFSQKGFDTTDHEKIFRMTVQNAIATDGPSATLDMDRTRFPIFISPSNVQDADFPGSFGNR
jgi:hypothetical protein